MLISIVFVVAIFIFRAFLDVFCRKTARS